MKSITLSTFIPPALLFCIGMAGGVQPSEAATTCDSAAVNDGYCLLNTVHHELQIDEKLVSPNGAYYGVLQGDCNFVVRAHPVSMPFQDEESSYAIWATNTNGETNCYLSFQDDGNLVLYSDNGVAWKTATHGKGNNLSMFLQDDGNLVIYRGTTPDSTQTIWSSHDQGCRDYGSQWCYADLIGPGDADLYRRLTLQHRLDYQVPLSQVTFVSSHNTYNALYWGYPIPNHEKTMIDQLNAGIRGINFDVHSILWTNGYTERLCHFAGTSSLTCRRTQSVSFGDGLRLLNTWLHNNPGEVVILVLEDYINKGERHEAAVRTLERTIESKVYRPESSSGCQRLPLATLTKQDVLDAGKQLIIATVEDCAHTNSNWRSWVWDIKQTAYKANGYQHDVIDLTRRDDHWSVVAEDRSIFGGDKNDNMLSGEEIADVMRRGAGVVALDGIIYFPRHEDAIWSWKANEPNNDGDKDCAAQTSDSKWQASSCSSSHRHACQHPLSGAWALSASAGVWSNGESACESLGDYIFSMPVNARENAALDAVRSAAGINNVWLNYNDKAKEGNWVASHRWNTQWQSDSTPVPGGIYTLKQISSGRYLDAFHYSKYDFRAIIRPAKQNDDRQEWAIAPGANGYYNLVQQSKKRYLMNDFYTIPDYDNPTAGIFTDTGTVTTMEDATMDSMNHDPLQYFYYSILGYGNPDHPTQQWAIIPLSNGHYRLVQRQNSTRFERHRGAYLELGANSSYDAVLGVHQSNQSQQWELNLVANFSKTYNYGARVWGGNGGTAFDDVSVLNKGLLVDEPLYITELAMRAAGRVDQVKITYSDGRVVQHGGEGGSLQSITLTEADTLQEVEVCKAHTSQHNSTTVHYIKFTLSNGATLAGGNRSNDCVTLKSNLGYPILGFRGRSGAELDSIGIIIEKTDL